MSRISLYFTDETDYLERWVHKSIQESKENGFTNSLNNVVINILKETYNEREGQSSLEKQGQMGENASTGNSSS